MLSFLWHGPATRPSKISREHDRHSIPLTVEELEERFVLSADTTVAAPDSPFSFTAPGVVMVAMQPKGNPGIVFLGDSITWGLASGMGAPVWSSVMAPHGAADYGVSGQTTQSLLYQLSLGQLVGIHPSVVVLTIGTNNLLEGDSPQATAAGILANVYAIHQYLPGAHVLVLGVPPRGASPTDPDRLQTEQTDALVQPLLAGDPRATFVNVAPALEQPDGSISGAVLIDTVHPTTLGYFDLMNALAAPLDQVAGINIGPQLESVRGSIPNETLSSALSLLIPDFPETFSFSLPALPRLPSLSPLPLDRTVSDNPPPATKVVSTAGQPDGKVANWLLSAGTQAGPGMPSTNASPNTPTSSLTVTPAFQQPLGKPSNGTLPDINQPMRNSVEWTSTPETLVGQDAATMTTAL
jgi:beta-glucosidase